MKKNISLNRIKAKSIYIINIFIIIGLTPVFSKYNMIGINIVSKIHDLLFFSVGYILFLRNFISISKKNKFIKNNKMLISFIIFILTTSLVVSNYKIQTVKSFINLIILLIYAIYIVKRYSSLKIIKLFLDCQLIINLLTFIFQFSYRSLSIELYEGVEVWNSSFYSKNSLAIQMALGVIISYLCIINLHKRKKAIFVMLTSLFILLKTGSSTSILIVIIAIFTDVFLRKFRLNNKINIVSWLYLSHIILYSVIIFGQKFNSIFQSIFNRDITLTGRVFIWEGVIDAIKYNMLFGTGYETFWGFNENLERIIMNKYYYVLNSRIVGAHNGFLDLILQIGVVGTIFFIILLWNSGRKLKFVSDNIVSSLGITYFVYLFIFFMTERSFASKSYQTFMIFLCIILINFYIKEKGKRNG